MWVWMGFKVSSQIRFEELHFGNILIFSVWHLEENKSRRKTMNFNVSMTLLSNPSSLAHTMQLFLQVFYLCVAWYFSALLRQKWNRTEMGTIYKVVVDRMSGKRMEVDLCNTKEQFKKMTVLQMTEKIAERLHLNPGNWTFRHLTRFHFYFIQESKNLIVLNIVLDLKDWKLTLNTCMKSKCIILHKQNCNVLHKLRLVL